MKTKLILITLLLLGINNLFAQQARFVQSGVITFEKSINQHATIKKIMGNNNRFGGDFEEFKKNIPQFKLSKSTLLFSGDKTLFSPIAETDHNTDMFFSGGTALMNTTYTDLSANTFTTEKNLFDEIFLIKDSTRKINWKLTSEMREIAGYECRRANAIVLDSIYVVAFYTDRIPVSGGPESFAGLPGMILGLALPHDNTTWFAKTVVDKSVPATEIKAPVKGKATNNQGFLETMEKLMNGRSEKASRAVKLFML